MNLKLLGIVGLLTLATIGSAQEQSPSNQYFQKEIPRKAEKEFQFLAFYINQGVLSNVYSRSEFMKWQVVGRLFG